MTISPLADRDAPFAELVEAWNRVQRTRHTSAIIVSGDAGCGKSRLVAETLAAVSVPESITVLGCASRGTPGPYDWLASAVANAQPAVRRQSNIDPDIFAWLTQSRHIPKDRVEPTVLRRAARHVVRELLGGSAGIVIVEDVHRLDPASADLVMEIAGADDMAFLLLLLTRPVDDTMYPKSSRRLWKNLHDSVHTNVLQLETSRRGGPGRAVWARYAQRIGNDAEAAAAALRSAAELVAEGDVDAAAGLIEEFLPARSHSDAGVAAVLAGAAQRLRGRQDTSEHRTASDAPLTDREHEVVGCLTAGMSNRQIARRLGISVRTVTVHVSNLLRKTRTGSRTEAALWAVEHGLTTHEP